MSQKIIFSMSRVSKTSPGKKTVIKDISLSFFYGAKIGVLGLNGAGKSTLLRVIAGIDTDFNGDVNLSKGISVGYLEQEPQLNPEKTVKEVVEEGAAELVAIRDAYEAINEKFTDPDADMDALRCPPAENKCGNLSGGEKRRVALCRLLLQEPDVLFLSVGKL